MNERERLVKLLIEGDYREQGNVISKTPYERWCEIADYLLSHSVTLPPCRVGDTLYQMDGEKVYEVVVTNVIYDTDVTAFDETAIGMFVFHNREEAETVLKKFESGERLQ